MLTKKKKKKIPNTYITTCPKTNSNRAINKLKKKNLRFLGNFRGKLI